MSNNIPIFSAKEQYPQIAADLEAAVLEVLRSGNYIMGQKNKTLEQQIARVCGAKHGIGVANGTVRTVLQILQAANQQAANGVLYNGNSTLRNQANSIFDGINQAGDIL